MEPGPVLRVEDSGAEIFLCGSVFRWVVHIPTGVRVRVLVDPKGRPMSAMVERQTQDKQTIMLGFEAMDFCAEYFRRARQRAAN
jgi:hypothetical protein